MESLNTFVSEMEADGQGNYSLFPALDSIASLSGTPETLGRLFKILHARIFNAELHIFAHIHSGVSKGIGAGRVCAGADLLTNCP